jgi:hypothetical protein
LTATLLLRIASFVSLLFALGHSLGGLKSWAPTGETSVVKTMTAERFTVAGVSRTYMDFYRGFGFTLSVFLLLQAVLLWQMAPFAAIDAPFVRPMIASFAAASLACTVVAWRLIMPLPALFSLVLTACLGLAFFWA